jgi:hypothetical protein
VKVSVCVAVASSRLISGVISGMAAMKLAVRFLLVSGFGTGGSGFGGRVRDKATRTAMVAPPVMRMGVSVWFSIGDSFLGKPKPRD